MRPDWSQRKLVAQKDDITYTTVDVQYDSTEHINCCFASDVIMAKRVSVELVHGTA